MIRYACPLCSATLVAASPAGGDGGSLRCPHDGYINTPEDGIRDFLDPENAARHAGFLDEYRAIRRAEHRGSDQPAYYLALPSVPESDPARAEWRLRTESANWLRHQLEHTGAPGNGRTILDAGAGNCWLTRRLAEWGNEAVALDLNIDPHDGLGAGRHYLNALPIRFDRVRADFTRLPFPDAQFDAVIFNGAFHYADNRGALLREALRVLAAAGAIYIIDSPIYTYQKSGEKMLAERATKGRAGYLTFEELNALARELGLGLEIHRPNPGPLSRLKRKATELRLGREIATMARVTLTP